MKSAQQDHIESFLAQVAELEEEYGVQITFDIVTGEAMLVNLEEPNRVVTYLGNEFLKYRSDYTVIDEVEVTRLIGGVNFELDSVSEDEDL